MDYLRWLINLFTPATPAPPPIPAPEPAPAPPPAPPAPAPPPPPDLIDALNDERARYQLAPLREDARLTELATAWAQRMANEDRLTHGDFPARISTAYPNTAGAEDIAEGNNTIAGTVVLWMNSPPHRANILGPFTIAGAGSATAGSGTMYWCVDFAARS